MPTIKIDKENLQQFVKVKEIVMFVCQCCGHEWQPRREDWAPWKCPLCQALDWRGEEEKSDDETEENLGGFAVDVGAGG